MHVVADLLACLVLDKVLMQFHGEGDHFPLKVTHSIKVGGGERQMYVPVCIFFCAHQTFFSNHQFG